MFMMGHRSGEGTKGVAAALAAPSGGGALKIIQKRSRRYRKNDSSNRSIASTAESEAVSLAV